MKTENLIRALAAAAPAPAAPMARSLAVALLAGWAVSAAIFAAWFGPREDIAEVATHPDFLLKPAEMLVFAALSAFAVLRLSEPAAPMRWSAIGLAGIPVFVALSVLVALFATPRGEWHALFVGDNAFKCLTVIPLLAIAPLGALLLTLRRGAPERPLAASAVAGLAAGTAGAVLYALHCTDDSPLFVAFWYSLAIAAVVAIAMLVGPRWLRW